MAILLNLLLAVTSIQIDGVQYLFDAAVQYLPQDLMLKWSFPQYDTVTFQYWIPHAKAQFYGWVGVALQDTRDAKDNFRSDYFIAVINKENPQQTYMTDRFGTYNGLAPQDTQQGCTNDIIESWSKRTDEFFVIYWTRKLVTGDINCDVQLARGKPVLLKWALGPYIDGYIEQHDMRDMGFEYFILSEYYLDNNEDERGRYGPWWQLHPQDQHWIDEFGTPKSPKTAITLTASDYQFQ